MSDMFDDGPLDDTRLAKDIAETVPGLNAALRHDEWRADLKRRVHARLDARAKEIAE